ncbi:uncharacterized protein BDW43DRAFT_217272 [Aspergillus alliaceus]|uniref:uncharacterized protein n=1 Tax=Petromyces alliaceus TaxID=209559 RepID=UPI0012A64A61|nr:uncharacterized protein BDW43DRAFT_217272 [Aspergillus alliaceus]KAB8228413.1 hypothetical protein BDW43DRAFT_217272 [Aspergillus alliaceus]
MLELPLQHCEMQCTSIALDVIEYIKQPNKNIAVLAWDEWPYVISRYKLTFRVALGKARLQKYSVHSTVFQFYQRMVEEAIIDLEEDVQSPTVADHYLQVKQNAVAQERKSIQLCLSLCNRALEFTKSGDFQAEEGRSVIYSIKDFLPEELSYNVWLHERSKNSHLV